MKDETGKAVVRGFDVVNFDDSGHLSSIVGFSDVPAQRVE